MIHFCGVKWHPVVSNGTLYTLRVKLDGHWPRWIYAAAVGFLGCFLSIVQRTPTASNALTDYLELITASLRVSLDGRWHHWVHAVAVGLLRALRPGL